MALEERTETELVALAQAGDVDAFAQLIERTRVIALALAFRLIANPETVRDVVQEAILQAFLSLDRLRDTTRFRPWFYGIVLNLCRTWLREQNTPTLSLEVLATQGQAVPCSSFLEIPDPSETVEEQELYQLVQQIVQGLSSINRSVIWLFYYEQMSMQEIATQLALSPSAVKNRLHKGRKELRRQLLVAYPEREHRLRADPSLDFTQQLVLAVQESIEEVQIDALELHLFYATVRLRQGTRLHEIKTTAGVALFVARSVQCPILVSEALMREHGVTVPRDAATPEKLRAYVLTASLPKQPQNLDFQAGMQSWTFREGPSENFDWGIDTNMVYQGKPIFFVKRASLGKGVLWQAFLADEYRGKRLRLSGFLKTEQVEGWEPFKGGISLGLQIEGVNEVLRQVNAREHPLQGTHDWTRYELEVDVPQTSISVGLGLVFLGRGQVWLSDVQLEAVDEDRSASLPQAT